MTEALTPEPEDPYGIAKYAVELDLAAAQRMFGLDYTIFRPHNVYGELQNIADTYRNVDRDLHEPALTGRPMTVFGDGLQTRAFTHIDDVAPRHRALDRRAGCGERDLQRRRRHAVQRARARADRRACHSASTTRRSTHLPPRQEVVHAFSDHSKLHGVFGEQTAVSLEDGLRRMAEWVQEVGVRPPVRFDSVEILRNLPPSWATGMAQSV